MDLLFLVFGLCLIAFALLAGRRFNLPPIKVASEKIGSFEMSFIPFLLLLGTLFAGIGQFFRWRGYEDKLKEADSIQRKLGDIQEELERFKVYETNVTLIFHDPIGGNGALSAQLYRKRLSEPGFTEPAAANRRAQQRAFDRFRQEYNEQRPHEALAMQTPSAVYVPSPRSYPVRVPEPEYPTTMLVRSVHHQGQIRWKKNEVFLSEVLWGERVGLLPRNERWFTVYFGQFAIARLDSRDLRVLPLPKQEDCNRDEAGEGDDSPSPAPHPLTEPEEKVSGMCPV